MSLLQVVKSVMDSNGWPEVVISVSSSQDQNMRQAFALANKTLQDISFSKNWPVLMREHTFTTVAGQDLYDLPPDFHHLVVPSAVNATQYYQLKGALTSIQWFRLALNGGMNGGFNGYVNWASGFRIVPFKKQFQIAPMPSGAYDMVFVYITSDIAATSDGTPTSRYTQDDDVSLIDETMVEAGLQWRWRQKKGLDYTAEIAEAKSAIDTGFAQEYGLGEIPIGGFRPYDVWPLTPGYINGPIGV
jgi:hypothetical protein